MKIIKSIRQMQILSRELKRKGKIIGFVPTMGFLHKGHLSLVAQAKKVCDFVVVSIFVNPHQFGPKEDFSKYPRDVKNDLQLLSKYDVDVIFYPEALDIYPKGYRTYVEVEALSDKLCGRSRPGHFRGVTTIVLKLFNIIKPDIALFGEKDFQQQVIIKKMVKDMNMDIKILSLPTIRDAGGLAMSSRNTYLNDDERKQGTILCKALQHAKELVGSGQKNASRIKSAMRKIISINPLVKIDYIELCDPETLDEVKEIKGRTLIAVAVYLGNTRLIDNIIVSSKAEK